jgi:hypothetical protein
MSGAGNWWAGGEFAKLDPAPLPAIHLLNDSLPE